MFVYKNMIQKQNNKWSYDRYKKVSKPILYAAQILAYP